jgi:four helix bundle protein
MRKELEERLIRFSISVIELRNNLQHTFIADRLAEQVQRSSSSAALNYGEAQGAETRKDFVHKVGIVLKELRETHINLRIIASSCLNPNKRGEIDQILNENNQLISIFHKTVMTMKQKRG